MTDTNEVTTVEMLRRIGNGWDDLQAYLKTLSEAQLTKPTDAAGWTVKDHVMHLAVWEDSINALFKGESRPGHMDIDAETWEGGDYDKINAIVQQRYRDRSWEEVQQALRDVHQRLVQKIQSLSDGDLVRPYSYYQPDSTDDRPVYGWIVGNTYAHYAEHIPWMDAIVKGG